MNSSQFFSFHRKKKVVKKFGIDTSLYWIYIYLIDFFFKFKKWISAIRVLISRLNAVSISLKINMSDASFRSLDIAVPRQYLDLF